MRRYIILISIVLFFISNAPLSASKMRIAVMNFKAKGVTRSLANNVSELIRNEMINTGRYTVIERAQMDKILKEQGFQMSGCTDVSCAVKIGKILAAKKMLIGTVMKIGKIIVITGRIVDVQSGTGEYSAKESAKTEDELYNAVSRFTTSLTLRTQGIQVESTGGPAYIRTQKNVYKPYEQIVVIYKNFPGNDTDWITIVKASDPPDTYGECPYTNGEKNGKMTFSGLEPGEYEVRVYFDWANTGTYDVQLRHAFTIKK